jgi:hypothetical protein
MGFITLSVSDGGRTVQVQLSDSVRTFKRITDVVFMSLRRPAPSTGVRYEYTDSDGDTISVRTDADVVELFRVAVALGTSVPLPVRRSVWMCAARAADLLDARGKMLAGVWRS